MPTSKINVAVAGVTNGLGNAIATALVSNPAITVTLLTRSSSSVSEVLQPLIEQGAMLRAVDYTSVKAVTDALKRVHTIISTLFPKEDDTPASNLLAAAKAAGVKRFAPSEFALPVEAAKVLLVGDRKLSHWEQVKASGMEYTAFRNGIFMDYFALGSSYSGPLRLFPLAVNMKERTADIPGTGEEQMTFTSLADIGKFVSAAVTLDKWPEEMGMAGETLTYNEVIRKAEETLGAKFNVTYLSVEELKRKRLEGMEKGDMWGQLLMELYLTFSQGLGEIKDPYLNTVTDVRPASVSEFLHRYWSKSEV